MTSESVQSRGIAINAAGGVAIGLLLACFVIVGGLPLILGASARADHANHPTRVDQRIAGYEDSEILAIRPPEIEEPIVIADARALGH